MNIQSYWLVADESEVRNQLAGVAYWIKSICGVLLAGIGITRPVVPISITGPQHLTANISTNS
jgi:hypothetical protein